MVHHGLRCTLEPRSFFVDQDLERINSIYLLRSNRDNGNQVRPLVEVSRAYHESRSHASMFAALGRVQTYLYDRSSLIHSAGQASDTVASQARVISELTSAISSK